MMTELAGLGAQFQRGMHASIPVFWSCTLPEGALGGRAKYVGRSAGMRAQVLMTQLAAKTAGYADVVYLDAKTDTMLEEVSSCNIFAVFGRTIKTPPLQARPPAPLHGHAQQQPA